MFRTPIVEKSERHALCVSTLFSLKILLFSTSSRPALGPTQLPIQWIPGALSPGIQRQGREAGYSPPSSAEVKNVGDTPPLPHTPSWRSA
jgi:hypothetical protein